MGFFRIEVIDAESVAVFNIGLAGSFEESLLDVAIEAAYTVIGKKTINMYNDALEAIAKSTEYRSELVRQIESVDIEDLEGEEVQLLQIVAQQFNVNTYHITGHVLDHPYADPYHI